MKKLIAAAAALTGAYFFLIAPGRADSASKKALGGKNYAHRGLHTRDRSVPENCLSGFAEAVRQGYGIEFDVHITADEQLVVFHDNDISRMCGTDGVIERMTLQEIKELRLAETDERIPTFDEVLQLVDGCVPLVIELKDSKNGKNDRLCELVAARLDEYSGPYCIESFHPFIVAWFRRNRPNVVRGQLTMQMDGYKGEVAPPAAFALSRALTNVLTRPHFIAHRKGRRSFSVLMAERLGAMRFVWTIHPDDPIQKIEKDADGMIFEFYRPGTEFKSN